MATRPVETIAIVRHAPLRAIIRAVAFAMASFALSACGATLPNITGGLGGSKEAAKPAVSNDPTSRAIQVGRIAGRAEKCGFVFDATKLRTQFLMSESATIADAATMARIGKTYDIARNAVVKAVGSNAETYCTQAKTAKIKIALNRHLAGDYTPDPPEPVVQEAGLFDFSGSSSGSSGVPNPNGPLHPSTAP